MNEEGDMSIVRIIEPEECDGVLATRRAFRSLGEDICQYLVTQEIGDPNGKLFFEQRYTLAEALLRRLINRHPRRLGYVAMPALRQALRELKNLGAE